MEDGLLHVTDKQEARLWMAQWGMLWHYVAFVGDSNCWMTVEVVGFLGAE
jgi:hypothetical protein